MEQVHEVVGDIALGDAVAAVAAAVEPVEVVAVAAAADDHEPHQVVAVLEQAQPGREPPRILDIVDSGAAVAYAEDTPVVVAAVAAVGAVVSSAGDRAPWYWKRRG